MKSIIIKIIVKLLVIIQIILFFFIRIISNNNKKDKNLHKKILIIKLWAIGEVILSTPVIKTVKENFPKSFVAVLVGKKSAEILKNNIYIDKLIPVDEKLFLDFKISQIISLIKHIKKMNFDILINMHHSVLLTIFSLLLYIPFRVGFNRNGEGVTNTIYVKPSHKKHKIDEYLSLTEAIGLKSSSKQPNIFLNEDEISYANKFLKGNGINKDTLLIGMLPAGSGDIASRKMDIDMSRKVWDIEYYTQLANILIEKNNATIIFFGGENEKKFKKIISDRVKNNFIDAIGKLNLKQMGAAAKKCNLVITNDSGPMHLLWALNIPIITIFGPTNPDICGPLNSKSIILRKKMPCSPCFRNDKFPNFFPKCNNIKCMKDITPENVWNKILTLKGKYF